MSVFSGKKISGVLFFIFVAVLYVSAAASAGRSDFIYIFDASGSMEGPMEGSTKFKVASKVLISSIRELPSDAGVGLIYFGNKIKGDDCIRFAVPVEIDSRDKVIEELKRLRPGGLTPLARSIELAAEALKKRVNDVTFVLVTDGKDECGGNPVREVRELARRGIIIEMHIIGLRVSGDVWRELNNIAEACEGNFYNVNTAKQFQQSLAEIASSALGEQILRLSAAAGIVKTSENLYSSKSSEVLNIKFRPAGALGSKNGDRSAIFFNFGDVRVELEDKGGQWELYRKEKELALKLDWPKDLVIEKDGWNKMSLDRSGDKNIFIINNENIYNFGEELEKFNFKVGVQGYDASFKELTIRLPLY